MGTYKVEYRKIINTIEIIEISDEDLEKFRNSDNCYKYCDKKDLVEYYLNENDNVYSINNIEIL